MMFRKNKIVFVCCLLMIAVCLSACSTSGNSAAPKTTEAAVQMPQEPTTLERGQQFVSDLGLIISIDDFAYSNDGNASILISGTVKNTSDHAISLKDVLSVSVIQEELACEGIPREDVGLTNGIGFHDTISAGAEEMLMDVVCTIEAMKPIQVKIVFSDGKEAIWNL